MHLLSSSHEADMLHIENYRTGKNITFLTVIFLIYFQILLFQTCRQIVAFYYTIITFFIYTYMHVFSTFSTSCTKIHSAYKTVNSFEHEESKKKSYNNACWQETSVDYNTFLNNRFKYDHQYSKTNIIVLCRYFGLNNLCR